MTGCNSSSCDGHAMHVSPVTMNRSSVTWYHQQLTTVFAVPCVCHTDTSCGLAHHAYAAAGIGQPLPQHKHAVDDTNDPQLQHLADELVQLLDSNGSQAEAAGLALSTAAQQQEQQQAVVPPGAFPWDQLQGHINSLVHKGQEAGWLAQPSEVGMFQRSSSLHRAVPDTAAC